ncbi:pyridoxamine 5'-phosphate oxidase family protein [Haloarcula salina]|uniref:Pyridoxamine 5'-phosphate oxidase family protein n=1 Tax=Haloarcula salina TaxID=1429914 RepID=A0AA41G8P2_9EURY|nr:pyridoxamine 5'-phosphate oxidase family protein [Haloarcula salina]MBV0902197.1 pyridoxamine 5'-phosphate oxidase family protein [Haloarcula salina]
MTVSSLEDAGLTRMDDDAIAAFLAGRRVGVLGLPTDAGPYMVPLSYGYDPDEAALYFTFIGGPESRKQRLTDAADDASVLVYQVESMFHWESVLLYGTIDAVPETEWDAVGDVLDSAWRPDLFERAIETGKVAVYRFRIDTQRGIRHTGLPPGFDIE